MRYLKNTIKNKTSKEKIKMKKTLLIFLMLAFVSSASALSYLTMDRGLLDGHAEASFSGGGAVANLTDGNSFYFRGYGDRVEFENGTGQDWLYSEPIVYPSELNLVDPFNFDESDIMTITGAAVHDANKTYSIGFIKIQSFSQEILRIVRVEAVLPELKSFSLILALVAFSFVAFRRRRA